MLANLSFYQRRLLNKASMWYNNHQNMHKTKKSRNEWKYICHEADIISICSRLNGILAFDTHGDDGSYSIHSLYFDDYMDTCALETEAGVGSRYKYRIRYYGDNPEYLRLERKEKLYGRCYKKTVACQWRSTRL